MRFFIVGNGFDLYHRLPTKYIDFIHFLEKDFPDVYVGLCNLMMKYSLTHFDRNIVEDNYWSEFEEMLGSIEVLELAEEHRDWSTTRDYSGKPNSEILKMLEFGVKSNLYILPWMKNINKKEIPKHEKNKKIEALIQKDSEFLNFNYSQTLEIIYNIDVTKVLHIHGTPPRKLIIGHSEGYNVQGDSEEIGINLMNEEYIKKYFTRTRKKTRSIIQKNNIFLAKNI
ncbi:bacteriophage abortive infection AbiH family protein [Lactococcus formosensis]|uniref:Bacteriophage abortive infection AbiH family protein n=1 Tax=Lactococcus formosensis TaxID=1281486 RepID=A0A9X4P7G7_9LACT|nr:AbiH family protein [Lactococcus formosensis]MDG6143225.1 bacteriophage abortive infection AbiH family protein [Lactococcus formosensis]MDG6160269.1 bacteriophage abortive infection AbiH family protein [Lactococcus formosensis]MDG6166472.1 bacteriophage abortive infection AbiH family protein [Lactococcus formosensis]MDG6172973.1 bacteriophage abortive infection AbiH family protein [Lactococcus formosensis]MDG6193628.1 bacteriophage abortive infection AbiH family protein [Lactococcus formose